jgi:hypothetical protein
MHLVNLKNHIELIHKDLSVFNKITFVESSHKYFIDDKPASELSVTRTIKQFKKQFELEKMASRVAAKTGATVTQIKEEWERNREYSATLGTILHKYIECFYTNQVFDIKNLNITSLSFDEKTKLREALPILINQFHNFHQENSHLLPIKNELILGDLNDTRICGTVDMLAFNSETNEIEILDFKTNKKMQKFTTFGNLLYPFDKLTEGEINEYSIQLNTYKYFLESYTNLKVKKLKIVWFNLQNSQYQVFELENLQEEIKLMINKIKADALFQEESLL